MSSGLSTNPLARNNATKGLYQYLENTLDNARIESLKPSDCSSGPCILGIDEAGRGPVLGPMTYAVAYFCQKNEDKLNKLKFADSKALTEATREDLFERIQNGESGYGDIGYIIKIIAPNMISNSMLRRKKYNLNALSHDTAIDLIKSVQSAGVDIAHVYIDTVGPPEKYKDKLRRFFPKINFTVTEKADSKYAIVSAASVCAKVMRDRIVKNWKYVEADSLHLDAFELGSGYPADPGTKKFLSDCVDPVFGFPTLARFSWSTIVKALEKGACECDWNEPEDEEQDQKSLTKQQQMFNRFFQKKPAQAASKQASAKLTKPVTAPAKRTTADTFFDDRHLSRVSIWD